MAITLSATTHILELTTSSAASTDWNVSWVDATSTTFTPSSGQGTVTSATTTTIVSAPGASTQRGVKFISVYNNGTASQTVTVKKDVSGTEYILYKATIIPGESVQYADGPGWGIFDGQGRKKTVVPEMTSAQGTRTVSYYKVGTAPYAAATWYSYAKDPGLPGAWAPGTPGLSGRATDGMTASDDGCIPLWTPTGSLYLTGAVNTSTVLQFTTIWDILWVNSGIVVTTTTGQTINSVAFPARDVNGTINGEGCYIGLLHTAASTNGGNITTSTVTYTNSAGTGSRTATLANIAGERIPSNPVIGNVVWFQLQAGDKGVQSIQTVTLATSLVTGSVSLIVARPILTFHTPQVNSGMVYENEVGDPGIRLYTGSNLHSISRTTGSTATVQNTILYVTER